MLWPLQVSDRAQARPFGSMTPHCFSTSTGPFSSKTFGLGSGRAPLVEDISGVGLVENNMCPILGCGECGILFDFAPINSDCFRLATCPCCPSARDDPGVDPRRPDPQAPGLKDYGMEGTGRNPAVGTVGPIRAEASIDGMADGGQASQENHETHITL